MSHLQKAPRDGTKWRFIPTCAWCRIDTQFIWKICNRHQGTVLQKHFFPMPTANHPISLNYYIIEEKINKKLFEPSLNQRALSIIEFSLFNIHSNLLLSSKHIDEQWADLIGGGQMPGLLSRPIPLVISRVKWLHFTREKKKDFCTLMKHILTSLINP